MVFLVGEAGGRERMMSSFVLGEVVEGAEEGVVRG